MPIVDWDGVTLTLEIGLSAATSTYGLWDSAIWDTSLWGPDDVWTDLSDRLRSIRTDRQFSRRLQVWQAGTATIVLDNQDGALSAANLAGPYVTAGVTQIRPLRPVRITATWGGVTYPVWRGYALDFNESWTGGAPGEGDAIVTIPCADEFTRLARAGGIATTTAGAGESTGARVHRVLDAAGHTGTRDIAIGENTVQATDLSDNTLAELEKVVLAEGGAIYVEADGAVTFAGQLALIEDTRSYISQATFADDGTGLRYLTATTAYDASLVVNVAAYTRVGGSLQLVGDATSRALYGDVPDVQSSLICETDAQALALAQWRVQQYASPEYRFTSITLQARGDPTNLWPQVLGRLVRDQVTVVRNPPGGFTIEQACHIAGIAHEINVGGDWKATFQLWSATSYTAFAASRWDTGLWDSAVWFF